MFPQGADSLANTGKSFLDSEWNDECIDFTIMYVFIFLFCVCVHVK